MIPGLCSLMQSRPGTSGGLSVLAAPSSFFDNSTPPQETGDCTAMVSGGVSPYTYAWSQTSGDGGITISAPTANITQFEANPGPGDQLTGYFICTVTDHVGTIAVSNSVTAQFQGAS